MDEFIKGYDTGGVLIFLAAAIVPALIAIGRMLLFPTAAFLDRWLDHHKLERTDEVELLVRSSLVRMKRVRTIGFVLGYTVPQLGWTLYTRDATRSNELPFVPVLVSIWTLAVVAAALVGSRTTDGGGHTATLAERHVDDYRPAFTRHDRSGLLVGLIGISIVALAFPGSSDAGSLDRFSVVSMMAGSLATMGVVLLAQRLIVARRQSLGSVALVRADDALRVTGVSALTGVGYGVPLVVIATVFWQLIVFHEPPAGAVLILTLASVGLFSAALSMVIGFGRLDNETVVYRHRLRPAAELTTPNT